MTLHAPPGRASRVGGAWGACVPGPGARFLVRRLFPRLASSSSVRRTCAVRERGPGVAPRRAWGCEGSARAVPPFFASASALGGREGGLV